MILQLNYVKWCNKFMINNSWLSRCSAARGSSAGFSQVSPTKYHKLCDLLDKRDTKKYTPPMHQCHAWRGLPVVPDPNPAPPNQYPVALHRTAAIP